MKTESKSLVIEVEDDDFLSQVAAAEAQALASKRRRINIAPSPNAAAKTGKNIGSQFYRCPANEGCDFFKWCNEHTGAAAGVLGGGAAKVERKVSSEASNNGFGVRTGSSCFKCGKEGHWARDCTAVTSYNAPVQLEARSTASPGSCYKCGKPGHWARDCPSG